MAANATNTLQATIISADANGTISLNRGLGNPSFAGNVGDLTINQFFLTEQMLLDYLYSGTVTGLQNIYVKNNAAGGGGTITVLLNLNGVGLVTVAVLQPGGVLLIWNTTSPGVASFTIYSYDTYW